MLQKETTENKMSFLYKINQKIFLVPSFKKRRNNVYFTSYEEKKNRNKVLSIESEQKMFLKPHEYFTFSFNPLKVNLFFFLYAFEMSPLDLHICVITIVDFKVNWKELKICIFPLAFEFSSFNFSKVCIKKVDILRHWKEHWWEKNLFYFYY